MNEYPACYDKAKRTLYRLLENVQLVKIPSLQVTRGAKSHPLEVPLQRQIDSEAVGRLTAKKRFALIQLSQRLHNVEWTACLRRCQVSASCQRLYDVISTSCACLAKQNSL